MRAVRRLFVLFAVLSALGCAPTQRDDELELTYYYLQYCRVCDATRAQLSKLPDELHGQVKVRMVQSLAPEAKATAEKLNWQSHGLVIARGPQIIYSARDHRANGYDAHVALRDALGLPLDCR